MNRSGFRRLVRQFLKESCDVSPDDVDRFDIDPYLFTEDGIDDVNARPAAAEAGRDLLRSLGADEEIIRKADAAYAVELVFALVNEFADIRERQDRLDLFRLLVGGSGLGDKLRQSQRADGGGILERVARKMLDPKLVEGLQTLRAIHGKHDWRGRKTSDREKFWRLVDDRVRRIAGLSLDDLPDEVLDGYVVDPDWTEDTAAEAALAAAVETLEAHGVPQSVIESGRKMVAREEDR